jgi:hypothetical protein
VRVDIYDIGGFVVCTACGELRGAWGRYDGELEFEQRCDCHRAEERDERWPGFDHNTVAELCRCCGLEGLKSGSKWSVWFCRDCLDRVKDLNGAAGRCVVPIGRHSLMNGVFYQPSESGVSAPALSAFSDQLLTFFGAVDATDAWRRRVVRANLAAINLGEALAVPVDRYYRRVRAAGLSKEAAFTALVAAASQPDGILP